jgi:hypothetical protein
MRDETTNTDQSSTNPPSNILENMMPTAPSTLASVFSGESYPLPFTASLSSSGNRLLRQPADQL